MKPEKSQRPKRARFLARLREAAERFIAFERNRRPLTEVRPPAPDPLNDGPSVPPNRSSSLSITRTTGHRLLANTSGNRPRLSNSHFIWSRSCVGSAIRFTRGEEMEGVSRGLEGRNFELASAFAGGANGDPDPSSAAQRRPEHGLRGATDRRGDARAASRRAARSNSRNLRRTHCRCREVRGRLDVVLLQVRKERENLSFRHPFPDHIDHHGHRDAKPPNAGNSAHLLGADCDAGERHSSRIVQIGARCSRYDQAQGTDLDLARGFFKPSAAEHQSRLSDLGSREVDCLMGPGRLTTTGNREYRAHNSAPNGKPSMRLIGPAEPNQTYQVTSAGGFDQDGLGTCRPHT